MTDRPLPLVALLAALLLLAACGSAAGSEPERSPGSETPAAAQNPTAQPDDLSPINFLLSFDGIPPIYNPDFVSAAESPLKDEELVIAIAIEGEAKAYPISVLRGREMVNDELAGLPILVTW